MSLWFEESMVWVGSRVIRKMFPSVLFSYASRDSSTDARACFFGGLGRGEVCPSDLARDRFSCPSGDEFLTVGVSAAAERPELGLLEEAVGGVGVFVMLILGFTTGSSYPEGGNGVEVEEFPADSCVDCVVFGVEGPDSFSSRRRRICNQRLATASWGIMDPACLIHLLLVRSLWRRRGRLLIIIHVGDAFVKQMFRDDSQIAWSGSLVFLT